MKTDRDPIMDSDFIPERRKWPLKKAGKSFIECKYVPVAHYDQLFIIFLNPDPHSAKSLDPDSF